MERSQLFTQVQDLHCWTLPFVCSATHRHCRPPPSLLRPPFRVDSQGTILASSGSESLARVFLPPAQGSKEPNLPTSKAASQRSAYFEFGTIFLACVPDMKPFLKRRGMVFR